jgi:hypothetical protein
MKKLVMNRHFSHKSCRALILMALPMMFILSSWSAIAQQQRDEQQLYYNQGGVVIITGDRIEVRYRSRACVAQFDGFLLRDGEKMIAESDYSMGGTICKVNITEREDGALVLAEEQACIAYHGLRCSFTGVVFPVDDLPEYIP